MLALTPNDEVNTLACREFATTFGGAETFQLSPRRQATGIGSDPASEYGGRQLFGEEWDSPALEAFLDHGGRVRRIRLGSDPEIFESQLTAEHVASILFIVKANNRVHVIVSDNTTPLRDAAPGDTVIALVADED